MIANWWRAGSLRVRVLGVTRDFSPSIEARFGGQRIQFCPNSTWIYLVELQDYHWLVTETDTQVREEKVLDHMRLGTCRNTFRPNFCFIGGSKRKEKKEKKKTLVERTGWQDWHRNYSMHYEPWTRYKRMAVYSQKYRGTDSHFHQHTK